MPTLDDPSVPMPNLPRIKRHAHARRRRGRRVAEPRAARAHRRRPDLGPPRAPDGGRGARARRALRLAPARRRGRPLEAPAAEGRRVPRVPLRRPPLPRLRQDDPAAERGRARLLPRPRLPRHAPRRRAAPGLAPLLAAARTTSALRESSSRRARAACSTRCSTTSSTTASRSSTRSATSSTRSRTTCSSAAPRTSSATSRT